MRRHLVTRPAWRARTGFASRARYPLVYLSESLHERLHARAKADNCPGRVLADELINRALDEEGAP